MRKYIAAMFFIVLTLVCPCLAQETVEPLTPQPEETEAFTPPPLLEVMECMLYNSMLRTARLSRMSWQGGINMLESELFDLEELLKELRKKSFPDIAKIGETMKKVSETRRLILEAKAAIAALDQYINWLLFLITMMGDCPCTACEGGLFVGPPIPDPNFP